MEGLYGVLVVTVLCCIYTAKSNVCIYSDINSCSNCEDNITTQDIARYLEDLGADKEIKFKLCSDILPLKSLIAVEDRITFSITGKENGTTIKCEGDESGLKFVNVTNITLENFKLLKCGAEHNSTSMNISTKNTNLIFKCSVYLLNCSDITTRNILVRDGDGTGLYIFDGNGNVLIENCTFENNRALNTTTKVLPGGGGLHIEFTYCTPGGLTQDMCNEEANERTQNSSYTIRQCTFKDNNATSTNAINTSYVKTSRNNFQGLGRGGGVCIHFRGQAKNNTINISNCTFHHNSAIWGGGINVAFHDSSTSNAVNVEHTSFTNNIGYLNGGGGIDMGFSFSYLNNLQPYENNISFKDQPPKKNKISVSYCNLTNNSAKFGGGVLLYSDVSNNYDNLGNIMLFENCYIAENTAVLGAGVSVVTHTWDTLKIGFLLSPVFKDCTFELNKIKSSTLENNFEGKAIFFTVGIDIVFEGTTTFCKNRDTALYITSSNAIFAKNSQVLFVDNEGTTGGAIVLIGLASMVIKDNSTFNFTNNIARERGGAIFQVSYNQNDFIASKSCFIHYVGDKNLTERQIDFTFIGNQAGNLDKHNTSLYYGHSIYVTTLLPCYTGCQDRILNSMNETFECIANFNMVDGATYEVSTFGNKIIQFGNESKMFLIPGKPTELPIALIDELNNEVHTLYHVRVEGASNNSAISMAMEYSFISEKWIKLYGNPGDRANVVIETTSSREVNFSVEIEMLECPPGFFLKAESVNGQMNKLCACSTLYRIPVFSEITGCDMDNFTAVMMIGSWIGYKSEENGYGKEESIISGYCPIGYCYNDPSKRYTLPNNSDVFILNDKVCGTNRQGRLCGRCRSGLSSYYHSLSYHCNPSDKCSIGWLFYLLTEIIPITIFFIVIIYFEVNFTTGALNGLVFYFQITDSSTIITNGFIRYPSMISILIKIYRFLVGIFNLNFFNIEKFSFCLWKNAQTLDLLAFKFVTIIYSLFLVVLIIVLLRILSLRGLTQRFPKLFRRKFDEKRTIIHGLSGFFVLCYSQCTKTSLALLTPVRIYEKYDSTTAVLLNGELQFFGSRHLIYAIPALLFLILFGLIPPMLLLSYPLCYKIFGVLKISESRFVRCLCTCIPLEKLKPFFDSFQSSFKDEFRFFSGLYFIYRLLTLMVLLHTLSLTNYYFVILIQFLTMFCIHAVIQPYKERWHNILDSLIFTNLIFISAMTLYSYRRSIETVLISHKPINTVCTIQVIFLYIPIVYFLFNVCKKTLKEIKVQKKSTDENTGSNNFFQELSESLLMERKNSYYWQSN